MDILLKVRIKNTGCKMQHLYFVSILYLSDYIYTINFLYAISIYTNHFDVSTAYTQN